MRVVIVAFTLGIFAATALAIAYPLPPGSRDRAEQYELWRAAVDKGERAMAEGRWSEAEAAFVRVIEESRAIDDRGLLLARAVDRLGDLRRRDERWQDAERLYLEAAALWERHLGPMQPRLAITLHNLGVVYIGQERYEQARTTLLRALDIVENTLGPEADQAADTRLALQATERASRP